MQVTIRSKKRLAGWPIGRIGFGSGSWIRFVCRLERGRVLGIGRGMELRMFRKGCLRVKNSGREEGRFVSMYMCMF